MPDPTLERLTRLDHTALMQGLELAREGRLEEALALLRENGGERSENGLAMMYMVTRVTGDSQQALELCASALLLVEDPLLTSTWTLRQGMLKSELGDRAGSIYDLTKVISMRATDDQVQQAQAALLALTQQK